VLAAFLKQGFNARLFAKVFLANVFNRETVFCRNGFSRRAELLRQRLGKLGVIKDRMCCSFRYLVIPWA